MASNTKWQELATSSHFLTAVAVGEAIKQGDVADAATGIQELIDTLSRADKRALRSQLQRLMLHVIKWQAQPNQRSRSWRTSIRDARREIAALQDDTPSLTRAVIEDMWQDCFESATEKAEAEMDMESPTGVLSWDDVFVAEYALPETRKKRK